MAMAVPSAVVTWISSNKSAFAQSLYTQYCAKNALSEAQIKAVEKTLKILNDPKPEAVVLENTDALAKAFDAASKNNMKRPIMRFPGFVASMAPANGKNPGAIYLKAGDLYLGKVINGQLFANHNCEENHLQKIREAMKDPLKVAVEYGRTTNSCSICGKGLTNKESIERGIGPICAGKFGF